MMSRDKLRLVRAHVKVKGDACGEPAHQGRDVLLCHEKGAGLAARLSKQLWPRQGEVCRDQATQRGADNSPTLTPGQRMVAMINIGNQLLLDKVSVIFISVVLAHAIDWIDHDDDQRKNSFTVDKVIHDGGQLGTGEVLTAVVHVESRKVFGSGRGIAGRKIDIDAPLVVQQFALVIKFLYPAVRDSGVQL